MYNVYNVYMYIIYVYNVEIEWHNERREEETSIGGQFYR